MHLPGPAGIAREARAGRGKARKIAREVARRARNPLNGAEKTTLWVVGGVGVLGLGYLIWQGIQPAAAATPPTPPVPGPPGPPGTTPSPTPPAPAPAPAGVGWSSANYPWAPPSNPAALTSSSVTQDISGDPIFVAMAQSALGILSRSSGAISYSTAPNGVVDTAFQIALTQVQATLATAVAGAKAGGATFMTAARTDGVLDIKTLAFLISQAATAYVASGGTLSATTTSDPIIANQVTTALNNIGNFANISIYRNIAAALPIINLATSLPEFQTNWNNAGSGFKLPVGSGQVDWLTWSVLIVFGT